MSTSTDIAPNLARLEQLLTDLRDRAAPDLADDLREAVTICQTRHAVHGAISLQLRAALGSLRLGSTEDAIGYIESAMDIEEHWSGELGSRQLPPAEATA